MSDTHADGSHCPYGNGEGHDSGDHYGLSPDGYHPEGDSSCFIATAVYGNTEAPEVIVLRRFRDDVLKKSLVGKLFIACYYRLSPPIADWMKTKPKVSSKVRVLLDALVKKIK